MKCYIENYTEPFQIDNGAVYCDNFNEKLDSMHFSISHLLTPIQFIKFQYFYVVDEDLDFAKYFVLDTFQENIVNLNGVKNYNYQIQLASEIKIFEKITLPNRVLLHSLVNEPKTIVQVIDEMMKLYIPKVKFTSDNETWSYEYAFKWNTSTLEEYFGDTLCPDLSFQKPTLRQVLTTLGLVKAKIPYVQNRTLYFIDLREDNISFNIPLGKIFDTQRSNSSDVFVNTLRTPIKNSLDNNNIIRNEVIGFRDSENVFLKQQQNLVLTTDFPIEKINKLEVNAYRGFRLLATTQTYDLKWSYGIIDFEVDNTNYVIIGGEYHPESDTYSGTYIELYLSDTPCDFNDTSTGLRYYSGTPIYKQTILVPMNSNTFSLVAYEGKFTFFVIHIDKLDTQNQTHLNYVLNSLALTQKTPNSDEQIVVPVSLTPIDLTPLVYEKQVRSQLSMNYLAVGSITTSNNTLDFSNINENFYTTLEYTYKSNKISGFSNSWNWVSFFAGKVEEVFIDKIAEAFETQLSTYGSTYYYSVRSSLISTTTQLYKLNVCEPYTGVVVDLAPTLYIPTILKLSQYATYSFNIEYVPFNELTFETNKKDEDLPIEYKEFDTQENTIVMLDDFSAREIDKVQRIGNDVFQISHSLCSSLGEINALNSKDTQGNIIFSRQIEFYDGDSEYYTKHYNATYIATKNYVLKNYFTALQNKYRAYEYSSTESATLRQELKKSYVLMTLGDIKYLECDYIFAGDYRFLVSSIMSPNILEPIKYTIVSDEAKNSYKFDLSIVGTNNSIIFTHIEPYANHYGIRIAEDNEQLFESDVSYRLLGATNSLIPSVSYSINSISPINKIYLGGVVQQWLPHSVHYKQYHKLGYSSANLFYFDTDKLYSANTTKRLPLVVLPNDNYSDNFVLYYKNGINHYIDFFGSVGERLSNCSQFIYYTNTDDIEFTRNLTDLHRLSGNNTNTCLIAYSETKPTLYEKEELTRTPRDNTSVLTYTQYNCGISVNVPISVLPSEVRSGYIIFYYQLGSYVYDIMSVKVDENSIFYDNIVINFSLNSTKTLKVYKENSTSGIWSASKTIKDNALFELN